MAEARVLLVDDHPVIRLGLRFVLEEHLDLDVSECGDATEAVRLARSGEFDLVILDVRLTEHDGVWVLEQLRSAGCQLPVVMISTFTERDRIERALALGASGYLVKEATPAQLREAVQVGLSGSGLYLHPAVADVVSGRTLHSSFDDLSDVELEVLKLVARGHTNAEIGQALHCSEKTVKGRITGLLRKVGARNRTEAAAWALRAGTIRT